jgi:hypothetical protein
MVGDNVSPEILVTYFNSDFVCRLYDRDTYQWGYDDATTLDSTIISYQTNQNYYNDSPDFEHRFYWVITTKDGCLQKTYYNAPPSLATVNTYNNAYVKVFPNPADNLLKVEVGGLQNSPINVVIYDVSGKAVINRGIQRGNTTQINIADLADGSYVLSCYQNGLRFATAKFIKLSR